MTTRNLDTIIDYFKNTLFSDTETVYGASDLKSAYHKLTEDSDTFKIEIEDLAVAIKNNDSKTINTIIMNIVEA